MLQKILGIVVHRKSLAGPMANPGWEKCMKLSITLAEKNLSLVFLNYLYIPQSINVVNSMHTSY